MRECNICYEENIPERKIVVLECKHDLCKKCYDKLLQNTCPFCRREIKGRENNMINPYIVIYQVRGQ